MGKARLLDCTLRDGAHLVDKKFGNEAITGIISGLKNANIDYIEIGYLQDEGFGDGKTVYKNAADAQRFVPEDKGNSEFAVMADFSRYSIDNLDECTGESIDIIRECFYKNERYDAMEVCHKIKNKGYKVFIQPADILGYSDAELLELIEMANQLEPFCFSIVDTFGSMYEEDLQRVYSLLNHNLVSSCKIGFHSHNNMQLSSALSQAFLRMAHGKREVVVDGTVSGMGRGAGNAPTELIAEYMVTKLGYSYDMDALLDVIDGYMDNIRARCSWGYTTPYFIAGCYGAHVNNVTYLTKKNSIRSKDMRYILNKIGDSARKRYHYDLLEQTYLEYLQSNIDDRAAMELLRSNLAGKNIVVIAPGNSAAKNAETIADFIKQNHSVVITVNFIHDTISSDYVYMSNVRRYNYWRNSAKFTRAKKILTSNIHVDSGSDSKEIIVSFVKLVKCGWENLDNSMLLLLRLLDMIPVESINIAGFDGYSHNADGSLNYVSEYIESSEAKDNPLQSNDEIKDMLEDYRENRKSHALIRFITDSRFAEVFEKNV